MSITQNLPFFCIMISMLSGIISFLLKPKGARAVHFVMLVSVFIMSVVVLVYTAGTGESYTYSMGHYPAPWGNEIRIGPLEALMAASFALIMGLSVLGGLGELENDVKESKRNIYYVIMDMMMSSLLALIYTNDMFTAYVFIEINTLTACGLILCTDRGHAYISTIRYMIMSLVGSGLFLISLSMMYSISGHLLMSPLKEALSEIGVGNRYYFPLIVTIVLMTIGLAIKSGMYPFHTWIPDAYGYSTPASAAVLSALVSKGYIILLIKIMFRVVGFDSASGDRMYDIFFLFGVVGMIMGSVNAIREGDILRMTAYSSVAQIGYIYMGLGYGTVAGVVASTYHILSHAATKALLFICIPGLIAASGGNTSIDDLKGSGYRDRLAGAAFTIGSLSMIGMPLLAGFVSKYLFVTSAMTAVRSKMMIAWLALAVSTVLNAAYFMRTVLVIYYTDENKQDETASGDRASSVDMTKSAAMIALVAINIFLGVASIPLINIIEKGLAIFG